MKNLYLITLMLAITTSSFTQTSDTLYYKNNSLSTFNDYDNYTIINKQDKLTYYIRKYNKEGIQKSAFYYKSNSEINLTASNFEKNIKNNKLMLHGIYQNYEEDSLIYEAKYDMNKRICNPIYLYHNDTIYIKTDINPIFQGGGLEKFMNYVSSQIIYPEGEFINHLTGDVYVQFYINKNGELKIVKILKGADPVLNNEAIRAINTSPLWTPGMINGKPVSVMFVLPIAFK